jgi:hypothetical protein
MYKYMFSYLFVMYCICRRIQDYVLVNVECVCLCIYVCMYVCMFVCMCASVCIYVYVSLYVCMYVCVCVFVCIVVCMCGFVCMYVCVALKQSFLQKINRFVIPLSRLYRFHEFF